MRRRRLDADCSRKNERTIIKEGEKIEGGQVGGKERREGTTRDWGGAGDVSK